MKAIVKRLGANAALTRLGAARARDAVLILVYHDLSGEGEPTSWLRVGQPEFDRQLTLLRRVGDFIAPDALGAAGERAAPGRLRLLLTFDDGYVNNHRLALPILRKHGAPALFFISTWHAETGEPFWFDRVTVPLQTARRVELDLRAAGLRLYRFHPVDGPRRWEDIQRLLVDVKRLGNPGEPGVDHVLSLCAEAAGTASAEALARCRPLARDEIRAMLASGLCHFGSHAHRHRILTYLDDATLAAELGRSRAFLEDALQRPAVDIAYPNGDADARVVAACRSAGFARGYTTRRGLARSSGDPALLPRLLVGGYDSPTVLFWNVNRALLADGWRD